MAAEPVYVVAGNRPWSRRVFDRRLRRLPGRWLFAASPRRLTAARLDALAPRYVFFLHWSWKVPAAIVARHACIAFHMTDLPYGRGGSPLQNLIVRGHRRTKLTAFRMTEAMDAGPVYAKVGLPLHGTAQQIYARMSERSADLIERLIRRTPRPVPQRGRVVVFRRRAPAQSRVPTTRSLAALYDFIRMLDAHGYPRAFVRQGGLRYELRNARLMDDRLTAHVTIRRERGA